MIKTMKPEDYMTQIAYTLATIELHIENIEKDIRKIEEKIYK